MVGRWRAVAGGGGWRGCGGGGGEGITGRESDIGGERRGKGEGNVGERLYWRSC